MENCIRLKMIGTAILASIVFLAKPSMALESADPPGLSGLVPSLLRLFFALILVLFLIYLTLAVFKRLYRNQGSRETRLLRIVDVLPLGAKVKLVTVLLGDRVLLLGAGEESVNRITDISREEFEAITERARSESSAPFKETLMRMTKK